MHAQQYRSFGCLIFESLTTDVPYRAERVAEFELLERVRSGIRPDITHSPLVRANDPLVALFESCTESLPSKRPSAAMLVKRLAALQNNNNN